MPDPRLKKAMAEMKKLCHRYRIGAAITLVSQTHAEFAYLFPDWSVVQPETGPDGQQGIRIRSYEAYYGDKAEQQAAMEASLHCLYQIRDIAGQTFLQFENLTAQVEAQGELEIEHHPFSGFEPYEEDA